MDEQTTLVLAGDVMTGRGVDQVLPHPGDPDLCEDYVTDARAYVELAERLNGPVPAPVNPAWPWGAVLEVMEQATGAVRVMNLETSITRCEERASGKAVHYRMSPANVGVLQVADVDVWALANNHVLDHGTRGLADTLATLRAAGQRCAGAGADEDEAWQPVRVARGAVRAIVASVAHVSSGVPSSWAAGRARAGVALVRDLDHVAAESLAALLAEHSQPGELRVVSVHWGSNWGYEVPREQRRFAHRLIDAGVDLVHGHSSHHPRPIEVYRDRPVLYGCGDLVNDYEGIGGYDAFRDDLRLLYDVALEPGTGVLTSLRMVPFRARRLSLERASRQDATWLADSLGRAGRDLGARVQMDGDGAIALLRA